MCALWNLKENLMKSKVRAMIVRCVNLMKENVNRKNEVVTSNRRRYVGYNGQKNKEEAFRRFEQGLIRALRHL